MFLHLSVILFRGRVSVQEGLCPRGSLSGGASVWESLSRRSLFRGIVSVHGLSLSRLVSVLGESVWGSLSGDFCPGASLSRGLSVQGGLCPGDLCPGDLCPGGLCPENLCLAGGLCQGNPLCTVTCIQYASNRMYS